MRQLATAAGVFAWGYNARRWSSTSTHKQADILNLMSKILEFIDKEPLLSAATIIMALVVIFYELKRKASGLASISTAQAISLINQGGKVIDIRDPGEFETGHIVSAVNIPASDVVEKVDKKFKNAKSIVIVCSTGSRSAPVIADLRKAGHENVFNLQGGLTAWQTDNLPLVTAE